MTEYYDTKGHRLLHTYDHRYWCNDCNKFIPVEKVQIRTIELSANPTPKTVEEVVAEFETKFGDENIWKDETGETAFVPIGNLSDWLRQTLLAQNQAADERLREVFKEILAKQEIHMNDGEWVYHGDIKDIAAKHGITNL